MEFGRLSASHLDKIDFSLPKEPVYNKTILSGKKDPGVKVFVGCAKWGRKEWIGKIYPEGTKEKDFLQLYIENYNSIEFNGTGYQSPSLKQVETWEEKAKGKDFVFCPKLTRYISPGNDIEKQKELITRFLDSIEGFGKNLGPLFLLLSEGFPPSKKKYLFDFLDIFPSKHQLFIELRNKDWYNNPMILNELLSELSARKTGLIITDTEGRRDMAHMNLTIPKAFIRFVGNSLHPSDYTRCEEWVQRIKHWLNNGLKELYFFMHMHDEAKSPELTVYFIEELNKVCKLHLHNPDWKKK